MMTCPSPAEPSIQGDINLSRRRRRRQTGNEDPVEFALLMDDVRSVRDIEGSFPNISSAVTLVPTPKYNDFEGRVAVFAPNSGGFLVLEVSFHNLYTHE